MSYPAGSAISYYILDISDAEKKAASLRSIYQGIRQDAASLSTPVVNGGNAGAQAKGLQDAAAATTVYASATQQLIADTIALGAAQGLTNDQINEQLAAMSRSAFAAGDLAAANELIEASLGKIAETLPIDTKEYDNAAKAIQRQADAELRLAQQQARTLVAQHENTAALSLLTNARNSATNASASAIASAETQIATLEQTATSAGAAGNALAALVSPVGLLTAGIAASIGIIHSFDTALHDIGQLEQQRNAFGGIIGNIAEGNSVIDEAIQKTREFGITEKETTEAFKELAPYIKDSTSSVDAQAGALARISTLNPAQPAQALASAIEGINSGRITSLRRELGLSSEEATKLVTSVKNGQDIFVALNTALDQQGFTLQAARDKMQGYAGAEIQARIAGEDLERAQAKFALGPGLAIKKTETDALNNATAVLSGNTNVLATDFGTLANALNPVALITNTVSASNEYAINTFNKLAGTAIPDTALSLNGATKALSDFFGLTTKLAPASDASTHALLREADADDRYTAETYKAVTATDALTHAQYQQNQQALQDQRAGERSGGLFDTLDQTTNFYDKQHAASAQAAQDAQQLRDAELGYARATGDTKKERSILNDELKNAAGDQAKQLEIKTQIAELDKQQTKGATKGLSGIDRTDIKLAGDLQDQLDDVNHRLESGKLTQLQRNELLIQQHELQQKINDAVQKEHDLQINIGLDQVHNAQKLLEENTELADLHRAEGDSRFSATQQEAIHLREQEILLDQQKRANDLTKAQVDLNTTVKNTGLGAAQAVTTAAQSTPVVSQVPPIGSALPVASSGVPQVQLAPGEKVVINLTVNVDKDGKPTAVQTNPAVALNLIGKALGVQVASGGFP